MGVRLSLRRQEIAWRTGGTDLRNLKSGLRIRSSELRYLIFELRGVIADLLRHITDLHFLHTALRAG